GRGPGESAAPRPARPRRRHRPPGGGGRRLLRGPALRRPLGHADGPGPAALPPGRGPATPVRALRGEEPAGARDLRRLHPADRAVALDEAFLDVTGAAHHFGDGPEIGAAIRARIRAETGLTASVGVAGSKLLAKLASDDAKPDGLLVVEPGTELAYLHPHPVGRLWGVGPATLARLARFGVETIGDLAALPEASLVDALGRAHGQLLHALAHGRDDRPVEADRETKSIGQEETFPRDVTDREALRREVRRMAERVGSRLREHGLAGRTVTLKVRFPDFRTITRSATLPEAFDASAEIAGLALGLLDKVDT